MKEGCPAIRTIREILPHSVREVPKHQTLQTPLQLGLREVLNTRPLKLGLREVLSHHNLQTPGTACSESGVQATASYPESNQQNFWNTSHYMVLKSVNLQTLSTT
jgi:hypothetical protein